MILVIGPHRSGTSITSKILQAHIGEWPFEVSRHSEPMELVDIHTRFLERHNLEFIDRLYFPQLQPDIELMADLGNYFSRWSTVDCVIKEPVLSITMNWLRMYRVFPTVFVSRSAAEMAISLKHRKQMEFEKAIKSAHWYYDEYNRIVNDCENPNRISFVKNTDAVLEQMKLVVARLGMKWKQEIFDEHWNLSEIANYKEPKE